MRISRPLVALFLVLTPHVFAADWRDKVDRALTQTSALEPSEFLLVLNEQADLSDTAQLPTKAEKARHVFERLSETAARTQSGLVADLEQRGIEHRAYWIANVVWARGRLDDIQRLAQRPDVRRIEACPSVRMRDDVRVAIPLDATEETIPAGVSIIGAPAMWDKGYRGQGVVVGVADTGQAWTHPALKFRYRGWQGISANHNYNWHDAMHECNDEPCDSSSHGTSTTGIAVGNDQHGKVIGVAPEARWIGCRNMNANGAGTPATYTECLQFFIAPTNLNGTEPNPVLAPDVINNSWLCPPDEGCAPETLRLAVEAVRAAGIVFVAAAGNDGPLCSTINAPPAMYASAFTVGASEQGNRMASFSSRGPVTIDGSSRIKPDVVAPGVGITSSVPPSGYAAVSGTSMAAPHVTGLVALLLSASPALSGHVDEIEQYIRRNTTPLVPEAARSCDATIRQPNNTYGWGQVQAVLPCGDRATICVAEERFAVSATWKTANDSGTAHPVRLTKDAASFWFFGEDNVELAVKVVDGRDFNGYFWVFYASLSNVDFTIKVTDLVTARQKEYHNASGTFASNADIQAFTDPLIIFCSKSLQETTAAISTSLPLLNGRLRAELNFVDPRQSGTLAASAVPLSKESGFFWFFGSDNPELFVKALDAHGVNGRCWLFYGGLTNLEFDLKVTDVTTGLTQTYHNPSGHFASASDVSTFCP